MTQLVHVHHAAIAAAAASVGQPACVTVPALTLAAGTASVSHPAGCAVTLARHHGPVSAANAIPALSARDCSAVSVGNLAAHQLTGADATPARPRPQAPAPCSSLGVQIAPFQRNRSRNLHFPATGP